jgi:hypothetical protein
MSIGRYGAHDALLNAGVQFVKCAAWGNGFIGDSYVFPNMKEARKGCKALGADIAHLNKYRPKYQSRGKYYIDYFN